MRSSRAFGWLLLLAGCGGGGASVPDAAAVAVQPWDSVLASARGSTVTWRMWRGDPSINRYIDDWVTPRLLECCGITLFPVEGQGPDIVQQLRLEAAAGAAGGADLLWINGETFAALRRDSLLGGPWADRLPNARYLDSTSTIVMQDFEQPLAGYESPWGRVQFALIYDTLRTPSPPRTVAALASWIEAHPGRFTHDQGFTGATFLKIVLYSLNGGVANFQGGFDESRWEAASSRLFPWLETLTPHFWRRGEAYPLGVAELHRLFANGEVDFSMSNNQNEVTAKVRQGILPASSRPLLLEDGTIANAHYLGIPANSSNPAGAMVVANFLLSPEAQYQKQRPEVWADGTVLDIDRLPAEWQERFGSLKNDPAALADTMLSRLAVPEIAPAWHDRLVSEWRRRIRGQNSP
ncbi:MAG: ABC transporter substrate-binding protein [Gemmatimonadales bacterium]|nr:ABC transporter substrate-binding protein [Gemmatimonadales bacterium]